MTTPNREAALMARVKELEAALEWIAESGRILYANELANEPYINLILAYREHAQRARQALGRKE